MVIFLLVVSFINIGATPESNPPKVVAYTNKLECVTEAARINAPYDNSKENTHNGMNHAEVFKVTINSYTSLPRNDVEPVYVPAIKIQ